MTIGKIIAWNQDLQRGIIESRLGETFKVERKDFVADVEYVSEGLEIIFEVWEETRSAYVVESNSGQFTRFNEAFGHLIT